MITHNERLAWFWNSAAGDMGLHAAPLEPSTAGAREDGLTARQSKAVADYNRIELVLGGLDEAEVRLLRQAHTLVPPALRPRFAKLGELAYVAMDMAPSPEWLLEHTQKKSSEALTKLMAKARRNVSKAIERFEKGYREWEGMERQAQKLGKQFGFRGKASGAR